MLFNKEQLRKYGFTEDDFCGPPGLTTGQGDFFAWQCAKHDHDYMGIKSLKPEERAIIDYRFYQNMLKRIQITGKWWYYPKAVLYYALARAVGGYVLRERLEKNFYDGTR